VLIKPALAGLAVQRDQEGKPRLVEATWQPILERDRWERLHDLLTDPSRRTNTSRANEPRWLVSGFAACGVCDGPTRVAGGRNRAAAYVGNGCCHVRRNAASLDRYISRAVVEVLSRPEAAGLLKPPPRPGVNASKLRAEARRLRAVKRAKNRLHTDGLIDDAELATELRAIKGKLAKVEAQLAASDQADPLAEFRGDRPAEAVWARLGMPRRRAVVQTLIKSIVINRAERRGQGFDPASVKVRWHPEAAPLAPGA
jgi:hypothetical protein